MAPVRLSVLSHSGSLPRNNWSPDADPPRRRGFFVGEMNLEVECRALAWSGMAAKKKPTSKTASRKTVPRKRAAKDAPKDKPASRKAQTVSAGKAGGKITLPKGIYVTVTQLAEETGQARDTVLRRLNDADVTPSGERSGYPIYRLRDALRALFTIDGHLDPERMRPTDRVNYYKAERERRNLQVDAGLLIPVEAVAEERARVFKVLVHGLEILPDTIERDLGVSVEVVQAIEDHCDKCRTDIYAELTATDDDAKRD